MARRDFSGGARGRSESSLRRFNYLIDESSASHWSGGLRWPKGEAASGTVIKTSADNPSGSRRIGAVTILLRWLQTQRRYA